MTCVHCGDDAVVKRGTTDKDAKQYWCKECETYFSDLTKTMFWQHRFGIEEMFYIVKEMRSESTAQIARDLDRDYELRHANERTGRENSPDHDVEERVLSVRSDGQTSRAEE